MGRRDDATDARPDDTPTLRDVLRARAAIRPYLDPTPLRPYAGLSRLLGADVWVKHENHLPTAAFKVRGGVHLATTLDAEARAAGLYTASSGNHGQSIAFGGRACGAAVRVAVPEGANPLKVRAMRDLGAEVVVHGRDFDEAREWIGEEAREKGAVFVGPTDAPLIAGVATYGLEIVEGLPDVDVVVVPVGAGSGACGCCISVKGTSPSAEVIAVQAEKARAAHDAWHGASAGAGSMATRAEGLQTRVPFENTQRILRDPRIGLDDFVLVGDEAMEEAIRLLFEHTRNIAEHAGAASLAAALGLRERLAGRRVVLVMSGGNLSLEDLGRIFG